MGFVGFVTWFSVGLIGTFFLEVVLQSPFITSMIVALVMGVLGARDA